MRASRQKRVFSKKASSRQKQKVKDKEKLAKLVIRFKALVRDGRGKEANLIRKKYLELSKMQIKSSLEHQKRFGTPTAKVEAELERVESQIDNLNARIKKLGGEK